MPEDNPIIIALDYPNARQVHEFLQRIEGQPCKLKVGLELFIAEGPAFVEQLAAKGHQVFLDLKLHDIPNTVASACRSASSLGVWMMTVHALGGINMLQAAYESIADTSQNIMLVAVTILTSMDQQQLKSVGIHQSASDIVMTLADTALQANMDGLVCSAQEVREIREKWQSKPVIVTPGIRLENEQHHDQSRVASPQHAHRLGSNYMVIGRPITRAEDPISIMNQYLADWSYSV